MRRKRLLLAPLVSLSVALGLAVLPAGGAQADPTEQSSISVDLTTANPTDIGVFYDGVGPGIDEDTLRVSAQLLDSDQSPIVDAPVVLERKIAGTAWATMRTKNTDETGAVSFSQQVKGTARYRVTYAGDDTNIGSSATTGAWSQDSTVPWTILAMRDFNATFRKSKGRLYFQGNINPGWGGRRIALQRKTCASCAFKTVAAKKTGAGGGWSFRAYYPAKVGPTWTYQAVIAAERPFIRSYSATLTTRRTYARGAATVATLR
jgi:hypothetical protein